ncbi:hypothetical protein QTO34_015467 [Cnephaeus nilssonii]|uniref:40S ribosomal protein S11 n=1 Tax=Cnephaeus nilssonii TaxID=3371016 RepID=A0AA40I4A3_CNENI|nr:hypothetical protein QTO34_015467 [Eptesicus nilssonii]
MEKPPTCGPGASSCSWLQPGRWRSCPPCSPGHQYLRLAVAWETEKPPTTQSRALALAAAAQVKPPAHHPLRLQPAWVPMADQKVGSPDPGDAQSGDIVTVDEWQPQSKTVHFSVLKVTKAAGTKKHFQKF